MGQVSKELMDLATPIIDKIAKQRKDKHTFAYFESKDISQEVWKLCMEALESYDSSKGELEHFLNRHVTHRLKNLKRDKYFRPEKDPNLSHRTANRINIINAIPMGYSDVSNICKPISENSMNYDPLDYCIKKELEAYIISNLSVHMVEHFQSLMRGEKLSKRILSALREEVFDIIKKYNE